MGPADAFRRRARILRIVTIRQTDSIPPTNILNNKEFMPICLVLLRLIRSSGNSLGETGQLHDGVPYQVVGRRGSGSEPD